MDYQEVVHYSYEGHLRAVQLFIKLAKRVRATIRQLGYPTKNALKGWHREYEQHLDLPVGYAGRRPKYLQAQKEAAVEDYLTHDRCVAATMRALGYPGRGTLTAWVREALPEARKIIVGRAGRPSYAEALKQAGVIGLCSRQESALAVAENSAYAGRRCTTGKTGYSAGGSCIHETQQQPTAGTKAGRAGATTRIAAA